MVALLFVYSRENNHYHPMKKLFALIIAGASGLYLATGWIPDPIPFVDEGMAFVIFINALSMLGLDLRRFVGMKSKEKKSDKPIDIN